MLQESVDKRKADINECHKQILYLESYSHRENPKFEGILELFETSAQQWDAAEDTTTDLLISSKFFLRKNVPSRIIYEQEFG